MILASDPKGRGPEPCHRPPPIGSQSNPNLWGTVSNFADCPGFPCLAGDVPVTDFLSCQHMPASSKTSRLLTGAGNTLALPASHLSLNSTPRGWPCADWERNPTGSLVFWSSGRWLFLRAQRTKSENGSDGGKVSFKGIQKFPEQDSAGKARSGRCLGQKAKVPSCCPGP